MSVNGKTNEIGAVDLFAAGEKMGIKEKRYKDIISEIGGKASGFASFSEQAGIKEETYNYITSVIENNMIEI